MWGRGREGAMALAPLSVGFSVSPSATHNQIGPFWCSFPSGWACACSRPLWVSPTNSPVRLGISPAAASTPTGGFSISGLRLYFSVLELWAGRSVTPFTSCYLAGQPQLCPPRSTIRHLAGSTSCVGASPLRPAACLHPSYGSG